MKKKFKISNIDCASCALKAEREGRKVDGVAELNLNFLMGTLTVVTEEGRGTEVIDEVVRVIKKKEPSAVIE